MVNMENIKSSHISMLAWALWACKARSLLPLSTQLKAPLHRKRGKCAPSEVINGFTLIQTLNSSPETWHKNLSHFLKKTIIWCGHSLHAATVQQSGGEKGEFEPFSLSSFIHSLFLSLASDAECNIMNTFQEATVCKCAPLSTYVTASRPFLWRQPFLKQPSPFKYSLTEPPARLWTLSLDFKKERKLSFIFI